MRRTVWLFGLCSLSLLLLVSSAGGAPGVLDPSFGASGLVTTQLAMQTAVANALVLQSDGKLVAVGKSQPSGGGAAQLALVRYRPDGTLDSSFGSGGIVQTPIANGGGAAEAALQQPDKKILVAGTSSTSAGRMFMLARYQPDGSLDATFGSGGIVQTPVGGVGELRAVALQPDGKIVAAGESSGGWFSLVRYEANGSLDTGFGSGGIVTTEIGTAAVFNSVAVQGDGKIIAAGQSFDPSSRFTLARYNASGTLDTGFGSGGIVIPAVGGFTGVFTVLLQADGKIVAIGTASDGQTSEFALARLSPDGSLDTGFGTGGVVNTPINGLSATASGGVLQPDGKIVATGLGADNVSGSRVLVRYDPNGSLDSTFGGGGIVTTPIPGSNAGISAAVLQTDGKIVVSGWYRPSGIDNAFALARFLGSTLTVQKAGTGTGKITSSPAGVDCGATCSAPFAAAPATLTATAAAGSVFTGWSGGGCSGDGTCQVQMSTDQSVTATFAIAPAKPACLVPKVQGKSLNVARGRITRANCRIGRISRKHSQVKKGHVISETPRPMRRLPNGAKVNLVVSKGRRP